MGGTLGRVALCNTATPHEAVDRTHSKAHHFKEEWGGACRMVWKTKRADRQRTDCISAFSSNVCIQHSFKKVLWVTKRPKAGEGGGGAG